MTSTAPYRRPTRAGSAARAILVATALLLPTLSLLPLGSLYLWEKGYLLHWAIGAMLVVAAVSLLQRWMLTRADAELQSATPEPSSASPSPLWSPLEEKAWKDVEAIARSVDIDKLDDMDSVSELGLRTIRAVAHRLHPEKADALWAFTLPEALAISERVSRRLGTFVHETIPFGDRLTIAQVLAIYRWRSAADIAGRAYDVWRLLRLANPATAMTHEARERLSKALVQWGRAQVTHQLAEAFVREVGRAAIDLYGGRLRIRPSALQNGSNLAEDTPIALGGTALDVLVAGGRPEDRQRIVGLLREAQARRITALAALLSGDESRAAAARAVALRARASESDPVTDAAGLRAEAKASDVVVWLVRPEDGVDAEGAGRIDTPPREREGNQSVAPVRNGNGALLPPEPAVILIEASGRTSRHAASAAHVPPSATSTIETLHGKRPEAITTLSLAPEHAENDLIRLTDLLSAVAPRAERVQLVRRIASLKGERDIAGAGWQALTATGSLAKSVLSGIGSRLRGSSRA